MQNLSPLLLKAKQLIIKHENLQQFPYRDTLGNITIGIGYNLTARGLPLPIIHQFCDEDILYHYNELSKYSWFDELSDARKVIIIDMAFNLGQKGLFGFKKMIAALQNKDYKLAAKEMLNSLWAKQVGHRAMEAHDLMLKGEIANV